MLMNNVKGGSKKSLKKNPEKLSEKNLRQKQQKKVLRN